MSRPDLDGMRARCEAATCNAGPTLDTGSRVGVRITYYDGTTSVIGSWVVPHSSEYDRIDDYGGQLGQTAMEAMAKAHKSIERIDVVDMDALTDTEIMEPPSAAALRDLPALLTAYLEMEAEVRALRGMVDDGVGVVCPWCKWNVYSDGPHAHDCEAAIHMGWERSER